MVLENVHVLEAEAGLVQHLGRGVGGTQQQLVLIFQGIRKTLSVLLTATTNSVLIESF